MGIKECEIGTMDVTSGFEKAIERVRKLTIEPFNVNMWICIALCALMESCGEPSANVGGGGSGGGGGGNTSSVSSGVQDALSNLPELAVIIPFILIGVVIGLVFLVLFQWIGARGTLMFIRTAATGDSDLGRNFSQTARAGHSLFIFNLLLVGVVVGPMLLGGAAVWMLSGGFAFLNNGDSPPLLLLILFGLTMLVLVLVTKVVGSLTRNLVAPIMWKFDMDALEAWQFFANRIASKNAPQLILFMLIRCGITIAQGFLNMVIGFATCCIGCLPFVNQFIQAPIHLFERTYSLTVLESLGPEFAIIGTGDGECGTAEAAQSAGKDPGLDEPGFPGEPDDEQ